jgi:hypothetical protein
MRPLILLLTLTCCSLGAELRLSELTNVTRIAGSDVLLVTTGTTAKASRAIGASNLLESLKVLPNWPAAAINAQEGSANLTNWSSRATNSYLQTNAIVGNGLTYTNGVLAVTNPPATGTGKEVTPGVGMAVVTNGSLVTIHTTNRVFDLPTKVVFDGDSLTYGTAINGQSYVCWLTNLFWTNTQNLLMLTNAARGGVTMGAMVTSYTNNIQALKPTGGERGILCIWGGINDIYGGDSGPTTWGRVSNYWRNAKADGWEICAFTITRSVNFTDDLGAESAIQYVNDRIRASTQWKWLIDVSPMYPDVRNTNLITVDGVHFTTNVQHHIAAEVAATVPSRPGLLKWPLNQPSMWTRTNGDTVLHTTNKLVVSGQGVSATAFYGDGGGLSNLTSSSSSPAMPIQFTDAFNPRLGMYVYEDFMHTVSTQPGTLNWVTAVSGAGSSAALSSPGAVNNHPGLMALITGTTTTGYSALLSQSSISDHYNWGGGVWFYTACLNPLNLATVGDDYAFRMGFVASAADPPASGVYLEYKRSASTNWRLITRSSSTETAGDTGLAVAENSYATMDIVINRGTNVVAYTNGVAAVTNTANIPASVMAAGATMVKSAGTTSRTVYLDWIWYGSKFTSAR